MKLITHIQQNTLEALPEAVRKEMRLKVMEDVEKQLLEKRNAKLKSSTTIVHRTLSWLAFVILCVLGAFAYCLRRYFIETNEAGKAISAQKSLLSSILNSLSDGVMVADSQGEFLVVNPAAARITGIREHKAAPENWSAVYGCFMADGITPYSSDRLLLYRAMQGERIENEEMLLRTPNLPEPAWISINGTPRDAEKGISGAGVVVFRDITMKKAAESRINEFISTVSHELRTPLTSVKGALRLIEGGLAGTSTPLANTPSAVS